MKKVLAGCLIVLIIAGVGFAVAGYYAYRWAAPMIENAGDYMDRAREMSRLGDRVANKSPYAPPPTGELTQSQVERFIAVQTRVRDEMKTRWTEIETKVEQLREKTRADNRELTFTESMSVLSELAGIYTDARRAQVDALNVQKFSDAEYNWVRLRVYEAAGMEVASGIDMSKFEELARQGGLNSNVTLPDIKKPEIPAANLKLVKPHLSKFKESLPLAFLGL
jgi:hypothetical protein